MKQKLVTFFLHDNTKGVYGDPKDNKLFGVSEHLEGYLKEGWIVKNVKTMGGAGGSMSGWVIVVLEKAF